MKPSPVRRFPALLLVLALVTALAGCFASADELKSTSGQAVDVRSGPAGVDFYEPPDNLSKYEAGDLIWTRPFTGGHALERAENHLVLYAQQGIDGDNVATSGIISVPEGKPPAGGWPVISWAHGTSGIADQCAPSRLGDNDVNQYEDEVLQEWLDAGRAIVRTDYEGLGTPGDHPYLIGSSEGRSVLDVVRAARELEPTLSRRVVVAGASQGGHAALWAAALAPYETRRDLDVVGTVAFAPPSNFAMVLNGLVDGTLDVDPGLIALILRGLDIRYPDQINVDEVLKPAAFKLYPRTVDACVAELATPELFGGMTTKKAIQADADVTRIKGKLNANDPSFPAIRGPIMILQGKKDTTVPPILNDLLAKTYKERGFDVTYRKYAKADHATVGIAATKDTEQFIEKAFTTK